MKSVYRANFFRHVCLHFRCIVIEGASAKLAFFLIVYEKTGKLKKKTEPSLYQYVLVFSAWGYIQ